MAETDDGEKKVKVKFLADAVYETEGRGLGKRFTAGRVYSMTADQAGRWVRRDTAELVEESTEADGDEPPKPRRGRPPKAKAPEDGDGNGDEIDADEDDEPEPAPKPQATPKPPEPPAAPKPPEPAGPGPRFVTQPQQPAKAPDKGR